MSILQPQLYINDIMAQTNYTDPYGGTTYIDPVALAYTHKNDHIYFGSSTFVGDHSLQEFWTDLVEIEVQIRAGVSNPKFPDRNINVAVGHGMMAISDPWYNANTSNYSTANGVVMFADAQGFKNSQGNQGVGRYFYGLTSYANHRNLGGHLFINSDRAVASSQGGFVIMNLGGGDGLFVNNHHDDALSGSSNFKARALAMGCGRIVVGDYLTHPGSNQSNSSLWSTGAVWIYDSWGKPIKRLQSEQIEQNDDYASTAYFGSIVAVGSGRIVVIESDEAGQADNGTGVATIYDIDGNVINTISGMTIFGRLASYSAAQVSTFAFGGYWVIPSGKERSVAIGDGRIVIGCPQWQGFNVTGGLEGIALMFDLDGNFIRFIFTPNSEYLTGTNLKEQFGTQVAIGNGRIYIGSQNYPGNGVVGSDENGAMYVFDLEGDYLFEYHEKNENYPDVDTDFPHNMAARDGLIVACDAYDQLNVGWKARVRKTRLGATASTSSTSFVRHVRQRSILEALE